MDHLTIQRRTGQIECWDDDEDLQGHLELRTTMSITGNRSRADRESLSSRMSFKSDGGFDFDDDPHDPHEQVLLAPDDDSTLAIESAKRAGIPLPQDIPASALVGGTIKRLGSKKPRRTAHDDWSEDLELPPSGGFLVKPYDRGEYPNNLHQVPASLKPEPITMAKALARVPLASSPLNKFREQDEDYFDIGDISDLSTLKPPKHVTRSSFGGLLSPPLSASKENPDEEQFDADLILPDTNEDFQLRLKKDEPNKASPVLVDSDLEDWGEVSLGIRHAGTSRARSTRSSSISMMSPSLSSVRSIESEDELLDDLELPEGPIDFEQILENKRQNETPDASVKGFDLTKKATKEDLLSGLEIGDGDVFDPAKLTLNRNVKHKPTRQASPVRRTAVALTFTNNPDEAIKELTGAVPKPKSRIPRLHGIHGTSISTLEPVAESRPKRSDPRTRYSGPPAVDHNAFGQFGSFVYPPSAQQSSNGSANPVKRPSFKNLRSEVPTTTSAQLLKVKRSLPNVRNDPAPTNRPRPPSRSDTPNQLNSVRPKSPSEKSDYNPASRVGGVPKQNLTHVKRHSYTSKLEETELRPKSRLATAKRAVASPTNRAQSVAPESLRKEAANTKLITRPTKKRNFGDGTELDGFDDLPTSSKVENKFTVQPVGKGPPKALRGKTAPVQTPPPPATPPEQPSKVDNTPRFARDTNASRNAREQRIAALLAARVNASTKARTKKPQQRPHLIKPLGNQSSVKKSVQGMTYNPNTYKWEGNENMIPDFESQAVTPPRPALISNVNANKGVQVVGGMVFDPSRMCWLKVAPDEDDEEGDPFEGVEDLMDECSASIDGTNVGGLGNCGEFIVGEEFDVGPDFVRRQREEEERWRRKLEGWVAAAAPNMAVDWRKRWELWNLVVEHAQ